MVTRYERIARWRLLVGAGGLVALIGCGSSMDSADPSGNSGHSGASAGGSSGLSPTGGSPASGGAATTGAGGWGGTSLPVSGPSSGGASANAAGGTGLVGAGMAGNANAGTSSGAASGAMGGGGRPTGAGGRGGFAGGPLGGAPGGGAPAGGASFGGAPAGGAAGSGLGGMGGAAPGDSVYPPAAANGDLAAGIAQLNLYRAALGLSMVTLDEASSTGCENHIQYLIEEAQKLGQPAYLEHTESDHENSHYSAASEQAGKNSDLSWGSGRDRNGTTYQSLGQAVDSWINGVYHRHPLLDPGLVKVGAASSNGYNCMNYGQEGNTTKVKPDHPILWPADHMTDVPRTFGGNEGPCPTNPSDPLAGGTCSASGFIISATFYNWGTYQRSSLTSVSNVTLTDASSNAAVPLLTWYADRVAGHDPAQGYMQDEIALVPADALAANTTYRVEVTAVVNDSPMDLAWTFTTGSRNQ